MWMFYEYLGENLEGEPRWKLENSRLWALFVFPLSAFRQTSKKVAKKLFLSKMSHLY